MTGSAYRFLRPSIATGQWNLVGDYMKAVAARWFDRYLYLDADMLALRDLRRFFASLSQARSLMMGFDLPEYRHFERGTYWVAFRHYCPESKLKPKRYNGWIRTMNAGAIFIDRDYTPDWKEIYLAYLDWELPLLGQAIWNIIFWKYEGGPPRFDLQSYRSFPGQAHDDPSLRGRIPERTAEGCLCAGPDWQLIIEEQKLHVWQPFTGRTVDPGGSGWQLKPMLGCSTE